MADTSMTDEYVEVNFVDSQDDHGTGRVVLLVHGTGGTTDTHFEHLYPMLAAHQRVVGVDWAHPNTETLTTQHLVDQVTGVIDQVHLQSYEITLVGYSLGAVIAALAAAQQPELFTNVVLISGWAVTDNQQRIRNQIWSRLTTGGQQALAEFGVFTAFSGSYLASLGEDQVAHLVAGMQPPDSFTTQQMDLNRRINIAGILGRITANTLVIGCEQDIMVPIRHQVELANAIAGAEFVSIDAGHAVVYEQPAELAQHIQDAIML